MYRDVRVGEIRSGSISIASTNFPYQSQFLPEKTQIFMSKFIRLSVQNVQSLANQFRLSRNSDRST